MYRTKLSFIGNYMLEKYFHNGRRFTTLFFLRSKITSLLIFQLRSGRENSFCKYLVFSKEKTIRFNGWLFKKDE